MFERVDPPARIECGEFGARGSVFAAEAAAPINVSAAAQEPPAAAAELPPPVEQPSATVFLLFAAECQM